MEKSLYRGWSIYPETLYGTHKNQLFSFRKNGILRPQLEQTNIFIFLCKNKNYWVRIGVRLEKGIRWYSMPIQNRGDGCPIHECIEEVEFGELLRASWHHRFSFWKPNIGCAVTTWISNFMWQHGTIRLGSKINEKVRIQFQSTINRIDVHHYNIAALLHHFWVKLFEREVHTRQNHLYM